MQIMYEHELAGNLPIANTIICQCYVGNRHNLLLYVYQQTVTRTSMNLGGNTTPTCRKEVGRYLPN